MIQTVISQIELLATALYGAEQRAREELGMDDFPDTEEVERWTKIRAIEEARQDLMDAYSNLRKAFPEGTNN